MNEKYLKGLHSHLGIKDDYDTWINSVKDNEDYLKGLHGHLGIKDDYNTWSSSVFGEPVKKKEQSVQESVDGSQELGSEAQSTGSNALDAVSSVGNQISKEEPQEETVDLDKLIMSKEEFEASEPVQKQSSVDPDMVGETQLGGITQEQLDYIDKNYRLKINPETFFAEDDLEERRALDRADTKEFKSLKKEYLRSLSTQNKENYKQLINDNPLFKKKAEDDYKEKARNENFFANTRLEFLNKDYDNMNPHYEVTSSYGFKAPNIEDVVLGPKHTAEVSKKNLKEESERIEKESGVNEYNPKSPMPEEKYLALKNEYNVLSEKIKNIPTSGPTREGAEALNQHKLNLARYEELEKTFVPYELSKISYKYNYDNIKPNKQEQELLLKYKYDGTLNQPTDKAVDIYSLPQDDYVATRMAGDLGQDMRALDIQYADKAIKDADNIDYVYAAPFLIDESVVGGRFNAKLSGDLSESTKMVMNNNSVFGLSKRVEELYNGREKIEFDPKTMAPKNPNDYAILKKMYNDWALYSGERIGAVDDLAILEHSIGGRDTKLSEQALGEDGKPIAKFDKKDLKTSADAYSIFDDYKTFKKVIDFYKKRLRRQLSDMNNKGINNAYQNGVIDSYVQNYNSLGATIRFADSYIGQLSHAYSKALSNNEEYRSVRAVEDATQDQIEAEERMYESLNGVEKAWYAVSKGLWDDVIVGTVESLANLPASVGVEGVVDLSKYKMNEGRVPKGMEESIYGDVKNITGVIGNIYGLSKFQKGIALLTGTKAVARGNIVAASFVQNNGRNFKQSYDQLIASGMSQSEAQDNASKIAWMQSLAEGGIAAIFPGEFIYDPKLAYKNVEVVLKNIADGKSYSNRELFQELAINTFKNAGLQEPAEEVLTDIVNTAGVNRIANIIVGDDVFNTEIKAKDLVNTAIYTMIGSGLYGGAGNYGLAKSSMAMSADMTVAKDAENYINIAKNKFETGEFTEKEFKDISDRIKDLSKTFENIKNDEGLSDSQKMQVLHYQQFIKDKGQELKGLGQDPYSLKKKEEIQGDIDIANAAIAEVTGVGYSVDGKIVNEKDLLEMLDDKSFVDRLRKGETSINTKNASEAVTSKIESLFPSDEKKKGSTLFSEPNPETIEVARAYKESKGIDTPEGELIYDIDPENSKEIADAYEAMEHRPDDPEVQAAYEAMANETMEQYQAMVDAGYTIEMSEVGKGEPYASSVDMISDVRDNKKIRVLPTEGDFGEGEITDQMRAENPLLRDSGLTDANGRPMLVNDVFRAVHDFFGHTERGNSFGAKGEENAWDVHARMYSPLARRAMTTETRGQNSWVNFGPQMRNEDGSIKKKGDEGYMSPTERPFAEQKIGLLPEKYSELRQDAPVDEGNVDFAIDYDFNQTIQPETELKEGVKESASEAFGKLKKDKPTKTQVSNPDAVRKAIDDSFAEQEEAALGFIPDTSTLDLDLSQVSKDEFVEEMVARTAEENPELDVDLARDLYSRQYDKAKALETVENVMKAMSQVDPNLEVVWHNDIDSYAKAVKDAGGTQEDVNTSGVFDGGNAIHINDSEVQSNTVFHEAAHAVISAYTKRNPQVINEFADNLRGILKGTEEGKALEEFVEAYDADIANEEMVTEFVARVADGQIDLDNIPKSTLQKIIDWFKGLIGRSGMNPDFVKLDGKEDVLDFARKVSDAFQSGKEIEVETTKPLEEQEQGGSGDVGTVKLQKSKIKAPSVSQDQRTLSRFVQDKDFKDFNGQKFVTNMYDFTTAGTVDLGSGIELDLSGGKNYVALMLDKKGLEIGDVSNLAAFNSVSQAEGFINNIKQSNASLFMPHSGTMDSSWQFQHAIFEQLVESSLNSGVLSNKDVINAFNEAIKSKEGKKAFSKFKERLGSNIRGFNAFSKNPMELVDLLGIESNMSPDLRKILSNKLISIKKFKDAIGINSKMDFSNRIIDPMNEGVIGGEIMGAVEFDNSNFEIVKTKKGDIDHHPSFGVTVLAKINGIYQPLDFYQSVDVTDTYTKYNKSGKSVSVKTEMSLKEFNKKNVSSSAGAKPKVAKARFQKRVTGNDVSFQKKRKSDRDYDSQVKDVIWDFMDRGSSESDIVGYLQDFAGMNKDEAETYYERFSEAHAQANSDVSNVENMILDGDSMYMIKKSLKGYDDVDKGYIIRKAKRNIANGVPSRTIAKANDIYKKIKNAVKKANKESKDKAKALKEVKKSVKNTINGEMKKLLEGSKASFSKRETQAMTRLVDSAETFADFEAAIEMMQDLVNKKNTDFAERKLTELVNYKTSKTRSGRAIGKLYRGAAAMMDVIKKHVNSVDKIGVEAAQDNISKELQELENQVTEKGERTLADIEQEIALEAALRAINALSIPNNSPAKVAEVFESVADLQQIIKDGRKELAFEKEAASERYRKLTNKARKDSDITGKGRELTPSEKLRRENNKKGFFKGLIKSLSDVGSYIPRITSDLPTVLSKISKGAGDFMGGEMNNIIYQPLMAATTDKKRAMIEQKKVVNEKLAELFGDSKMNPAHVRAALRGRKSVSITQNDGGTVDLSQMELATIYNMAKNEDLLDDLYSVGFGSEQISEILDKMEPEVKAFADWLVDEFYPNYYPRINDVYKDIYRTNMPIAKSYAGKLYREGGANETSYDLFESPKAFNSHMSAGSTKQRTKNNAKLEFTDSFMEMFKYIEEMENFIAFARPYKDAKKILSDATVKSNVEEYSGKGFYSLANDLIDKMVKPSYAGPADQFVNWMMGKFILPKMALNLSILPKQASSFIAFANSIPNGRYAEYALRVVGKDNLGVGTAGATFYAKASNVWREMYNNSAVLQDRYDGDIKEQLAPFKGKEGSVFGPRGKHAKKMINDFFMFAVKQGDKRGVMGAMPVYLYHKDQFMKKYPNKTEQEAIDYAVAKTEPVILETQQSADAIHKDITQLGSPWLRAFNVFLTTPKQYLRQEIRSGREVGRHVANVFRSSENKRGTKGSFARNVAHFALFHSVLPASFQWIINGMPGLIGDWDDEDTSDVLTASALGNINGLFMLGDLISNIKDYAEGKPYAAPIGVPIFEPIENIYINYFKYKKAKTGETKDKYMNKVWDSLIELTGIPASRIRKMGENYEGFVDAYKDGDERKMILNALMYSQYLIEEQGKKKSKGSRSSKKKGRTIGNRGSSGKSRTTGSR